MFLEVPDILTPDELAEIRRTCASGNWDDGRATAGRMAAVVKRNEELRPVPGGAPVEQRVGQALLRSERFRSLTFARRLSTPMINRYRTGMEYGTHVDNAVIGDPPLRGDLSVTVFLSDPDSYDGGHLVVETPAGEVELKLAAGSAAVYPGSMLHRVEPVTRGERLAAICWVQSVVRDPAVREILIDLGATLALLAQSAPDSEAAKRLARAHHNLLRIHAET